MGWEPVHPLNHGRPGGMARTGVRAPQGRCMLLFKPRHCGKGRTHRSAPTGWPTDRRVGPGGKPSPSRQSRDTSPRGRGKGPPQNHRFCGERRKEWSGRSPRRQAGTEQSGISSDEMGGALHQPSLVANPPRPKGEYKPPPKGEPLRRPLCHQDLSTKPVSR